MNRMAVKSNALNLVDASAYWENVEQLEELKGKHIATVPKKMV